MPLIFDRYPLDDAAKVSITKDGYLIATPRVARTGIQLYYGRELGVTGKDATKVFKIYRSEAEVFSKDSMASYAYKPVTDDHPPENVTVDNWKKYARGQMSGDVARDGDFIRVPMALMDGGLVQKYKDGKAELSMGYECDIVWQPCTDPKTGEVADGSQANIRINHNAVVDAARGGQDLRIGDGSGARVDLGVYAQALEAIAAGNVNKESALADGGHLAKDSKGISIYPILKDGVVYASSLRANKTDAVTKGDGDVIAALDNLLARAEGTSTSAVADRQQETVIMKVISIDGVPCQVDNDQTAAVIQRALDSSAAALKTAQDAFTKSNEENEKNKKKIETDAATHATVLATKDAEIVTLKKTVEDSKLSPQKLDQLVKDRALIAGKARAVLGDKLVVVDKTDHQIMKQVVDSKLGDAAKDWNEDQVKISFDTLTAGTKPLDATVSGLGDTARAFSAPSYGSGDARAQVEQAADARDKRLSDAWKGQAASA